MEKGSRNRKHALLSVLHPVPYDGSQESPGKNFMNVLLTIDTIFFSWTTNQQMLYQQKQGRQRTSTALECGTHYYQMPQFPLSVHK